MVIIPFYCFPLTFPTLCLKGKKENNSTNDLRLCFSVWNALCMYKSSFMLSILEIKIECKCLFLLSLIIYRFTVIYVCCRRTIFNKEVQTSLTEHTTDGWISAPSPQLNCCTQEGKLSQLVRCCHLWHTSTSELAWFQTCGCVHYSDLFNSETKWQLSLDYHAASKCAQ